MLTKEMAAESQTGRSTNLIQAVLCGIEGCPAGWVKYGQEHKIVISLSPGSFQGELNSIKPVRPGQARSNQTIPSSGENQTESKWIKPVRVQRSRPFRQNGAEQMSVPAHLI